MKFNLPDVALKKLKSMTLSVTVGAVKLTPETFTTSGEHEYRREVPASVLHKDAVDIAFSLDHYLAPTATQNRELGIVVTSVELEPK